MITPTIIRSDDPAQFVQRIISAATSADIEEILKKLPICGIDKFAFDPDAPERGWQPGLLHWVPVGRDRGNAGRIKLANRPVNPPVERTINGMEAMIELERRRELAVDPKVPAPSTPREAVRRYFSLPPLDELPDTAGLINGLPPRRYAREIARNIVVQLNWDKQLREWVVVIRDHGIGQPPQRMHKTLLSLGSSDKGDKPYLIGVFGQGGSSAYAASHYSTVVSRRAPDLLDGYDDGIGWTIVKHIFPKGRRDDYFAYLAAHPDGRVPSFDVAVAEATKFTHGTRFAHIKYDFGGGGAAVTRNFWQMINHSLFNPILPFDTEVAGTVATVYGNGYRLSNLEDAKISIDKTFTALQVEK
jgi:hypothetical protein